MASLMDIQLECVHVEQQQEVIAEKYERHHEMETHDLAQY